MDFPMQKTVEFESEELPFDLRNCKIGQEYNMTVVAKMVGENKDLGSPHRILFKILSIITPDKEKKYKRHWLF